MRTTRQMPAEERSGEKRKTGFVRVFKRTIAVGTAVVMFTSCAGGMKGTKPPLPAGVSLQAEISQRCEDMKEIVGDLKKQCGRNDASACTLFNQHEDIYYQVCEIEPRIKALKMACADLMDTKTLDNQIAVGESEIEKLSAECVNSKGKSTACELFGMIGAFQSALKKIREVLGDIQNVCIQVFGEEKDKS